MVGDEYEKKALEQGFKSICGIDEAGRGPLAGPVFAAAVILPVGLEIEGLNDSKKLSEKKRESLFDVIISNASAYSVAYADHAEIDEINILNATFLAMTRAVNGLKNSRGFALVDGEQSAERSFGALRNNCQGRRHFGVHCSRVDTCKGKPRQGHEKGR